MTYVLFSLAEAGDSRTGCRAAEALGLTRVEERGNVLLAESYDEVVFDGLWQRDGVNYVAPAQLAVDLLTIARARAG